MTTDWKSLIDSDDQAKLLAEFGNDSGCAERLNLIVPASPQPTQVNYLTLADLVGAEITRRLIISVRAVAAQDPLVDEMQNVLRTHTSGVDVSNVDTQSMLAAFVVLTTNGTVAAGMTADDAASIQALCMVKPIITTADVSAAMDESRREAKGE